MPRSWRGLKPSVNHGGSSSASDGDPNLSGSHPRTGRPTPRTRRRPAPTCPSVLAPADLLTSLRGRRGALGDIARAAVRKSVQVLYRPGRGGGAWGVTLTHPEGGPSCQHDDRRPQFHRERRRRRPPGRLSPVAAAGDRPLINSRARTPWPWTATATSMCSTPTTFASAPMGRGHRTDTDQQGKFSTRAPATPRPLPGLERMVAPSGATQRRGHTAVVGPS